MEEKQPPKLAQHPRRHCPECGPEPGYMDALSFLGGKPDGYFCRSCKGYFADGIDGDLRKLAVVILQ